MMHSFCEMVQIIISYVGLFIYGIDAKSTFNYSLHIRQNLIMYMFFFQGFVLVLQGGLEYLIIDGYKDSLYL
jgi:hypothetical protein